MQNSFRRLLLTGAACAALQTAAAQTTVLRNDDLSSMSGWFNSSTSGISLLNGGLSVSAGRHALTYFAPSATPQALASGETLQVTFDLSFTTVGTTSGGFRVGLFDSNGATRPTANGVSTTFQGYDGYAFTFTPNPGADSNSLNLRKRLTDGTNQLLSSITDGTNYSIFNSGNSSSSGSASGQVFQTGTVYAATYSISRGSGNALTIDFSVTGGAASWNFGKSYSIVGPNDLAFDAFAILSVSNTAPSSGSNFAIDNLRILHTAASSGGLSALDVGGGAIPEPSTYALGAGLAALGLAWWRRRRAV
jgi:MYXO-CTERM domain-containing protein